MRLRVFDSTLIKYSKKLWLYIMKNANLKCINSVISTNKSFQQLNILDFNILCIQINYC